MADEPELDSHADDDALDAVLATIGVATKSADATGFALLQAAYWLVKAARDPQTDHRVVKARVHDALRELRTAKDD
jgi:hypothetical protein